MLNYKKFFALATSCAITSIASIQTQAAEYEFDSATVSWDTSISLGAQFRIEERNRRISVGSSGEVSKGEVALDNLPNIIDNAFILNSNDGNNNFDRGDMTALRLSILSEADINFGDWGVFLRGKIWQDNVFASGSSAMSDEAWVSNNTNPVFGDANGYNAMKGDFNPGAVNYYSNGATMLDSFWYGSIPIMNDRELTLRIGKQVISWGEALLSGGGLATSINHVDADIRNQPGFDLKELFLPTNAIFIQTPITDSINLEAYYQLEWNPVILPASGSYWSEFDSIGPGGETFLFLTGTEREILGVDIGSQQDLRDQGYIAGQKLVDGSNNPDWDGDPNNPLYAPGWDYDANTLLAFLPVNCNPGDDKNSRCRGLIPYKVLTDEAKNTGQFGFAFNFFLDNGDEAGFYFVNYHEKIPNFILPIDALEEFSPILEVIMNGASILESYQLAGGGREGNSNIENLAAVTTALAEARATEYTPFSGINDLGSNLSPRQITGLLSFLGVLPEESASIKQIASNIVSDPSLLNPNNPTPDITQLSSLTNVALTGVSNIIAGPFLNAAFPYKNWDGDTTIRSINYRIKYAEDVRMLGLTYSTVIGNANVATELTYRPNTPLLGGDVSRKVTREQLVNWHINTLMVFEPSFLWDFSSFTAEVITWFVPGKKPYDVNDSTNPDRLAVQNDPVGIGASMFWSWEYSNVFTGWDVFIPWYVNWGIKGAQFNSGYRDGQVTFATGATFRHLSGFEAGVGLFTLFGDTDDIFQMLLQDRDSVSFTMKYAF